MRKIATPWGTATVTGKLGQAHADFVEAVLRNAEAWRDYGEGQLQVRVDPYRVRTSMGGGKKISYEQMWQVAGEVRRASIDMVIERPGGGLRVHGGILDLIVESRQRVTDPAATLRRTAICDSDEATDGGRALWEVTLNAAFVTLIGSDLSLNYDPQPLARLATGIAQALARFVFTHRNQPQGGWKVDTLIAAVGASDGAQAIRDRRRELKRDAAKLAEVGIVLSGDRVFHERRGANAPRRGVNAPSRGAGAPHVEQTPQAARNIQAIQA